MNGKKFFVVGNWKMNVTKYRIDSISKFINSASLDEKAEVVIGCPACYLSYARQQLSDSVSIAAQNCYKVEHGNYTGEVSPRMVAECGADWVILGHPERRTIFRETDEIIGQKVNHALKAGMKVIACVCETLEDRKSNRTEAVLFEQMSSLASAITDWSKVVLAFEALWASNTGVLATPKQVQQVLSSLRQWLKDNVGENVAQDTRILYAGSVSSSNCQELASLPDVDGFLVGSSALKEDLVDIVNSRSRILDPLSLDQLRINERQN